MSIINQEELRLQPWLSEDPNRQLWSLWSLRSLRPVQRQPGDPRVRRPVQQLRRAQRRRHQARTRQVTNSCHKKLTLPEALPQCLNLHISKYSQQSTLHHYCKSLDFILNSACCYCLINSLYQLQKQCALFYYKQTSLLSYFHKSNGNRRRNKG